MKIAIDISNMHPNSQKRGIGVSTQNLVAAIKKYTGEEVFVIENSQQKFIADVVHYPFFDLFRTSLPLKNKIPTVVTIHDVIPLIFPQHYPPGIKGKIKNFYQKMALKNVQAVITVSLSAKNDIHKYLKLDQGKIFAIYHGPPYGYKKINDKKSTAKIKMRYNLPDVYGLFVGSANWNKNIVNLAEGCLRANIDLVLVGEDFIKLPNVHAELQAYNRFYQRYSHHPKVHRLGFVSTEDLVGIYNLSLVSLLPSFYEGFGLTILEAQSCKIPVITSNVSSMPEIAGDGAILVDPNSSQDIADKINQTKADSNLRNELIAKGVKNLARFSWEKTAHETVDVYNKAINSNHESITY